MMHTPTYSMHDSQKHGAAGQVCRPAAESLAARWIRKVANEGIGYSVVDLSDVRHIFAAAAPRRGTTLREQADDALHTIAAAVEAEGSQGSIVHQAVFIADVDKIDECRQIIRGFYGADLPATSYVPQPPCDGKLLAIEALGVGQGRGSVELQRISEQLVIARHNGIAWIHCAQAVSQTGNGSVPHVYDAATCAFTQFRSLLGGAGTGCEQVLRTWLYLGGMLEREGSRQRYEELNRARADYYRNISFLSDRLPQSWTGPVYPASTGIGTEGRGVMISGIALATDRDDIVAVPLENPRQTSAFAYGRNYGPQSPKFARAMAVSCGSYATIFISGTASITDSETRHVGDVAGQTEETLDNIAALIAEENVARHGLPGLGASLDDLALARVYIARRADYAAVRAICQKRLGELPTIYAVADVCRSDLLVEIEGIAFAAKRTPA